MDVAVAGTADRSAFQPPGTVIFGHDFRPEADTVCMLALSQVYLQFERIQKGHSEDTPPVWAAHLGDRIQLPQRWRSSCAAGQCVQCVHPACSSWCCVVVDADLQVLLTLLSQATIRCNYVPDIVPMLWWPAQEQYTRQALAYLNNEPAVERYAWFTTRGYGVSRCC